MRGYDLHQVEIQFAVRPQRSIVTVRNICGIPVHLEAEYNANLIQQLAADRADNAANIIAFVAAEMSAMWLLGEISDAIY